MPLGANSVSIPSNINIGGRSGITFDPGDCVKCMNMKRGVKFLIQNKYQSFFCDILKGMDIKNYTWRIDNDNDQVYTLDNTFFFDKDHYTGGEFEALISKSQDYYVVFASVLAYPNSENANLDIPKDYAEFKAGECQLIVLCCDCEWVEIYCKDLELLKVIRENVLSNDYNKLTDITDENDWRTNFQVI